MPDSDVNWNDVIKKEARGLDGADLGAKFKDLNKV